jgi:hypothetical protein
MFVCLFVIPSDFDVKFSSMAIEFWKSLYLVLVLCVEYLFWIPSDRGAEYLNVNHMPPKTVALTSLFLFLKDEHFSIEIYL